MNAKRPLIDRSSLSRANGCAPCSPSSTLPPRSKASSLARPNSKTVAPLPLLARCGRELSTWFGAVTEAGLGGPGWGLGAGAGLLSLSGGVERAVVLDFVGRGGSFDGRRGTRREDRGATRANRVDGTER